MWGCPGTPGPCGWACGPMGPVGPGPHIPGPPWGCILAPIMLAAGPMGCGPGWCGEPTMWGPGWWGWGEGPPPPICGWGAWGDPLIIPWGGIGWGLGEAPLRWGPPVTPACGVGGPPWVGVVAGCGGGKLGGPVGPVAASGGSGPFAMLFNWVSEAAADAIACKGFVAPLVVLMPPRPVPAILWPALLFPTILLLLLPVFWRPALPLLEPLLAAPTVLLALLLTPPPSDCKEGGSGGEPAGGAAGPPRHRPDGPEAVTLLGATGTPACSGIPPGGRCATLTGITPPSTTPFTLSSNSRRPDDWGTSAGISRCSIRNLSSFHDAKSLVNRISLLARFRGTIFQNLLRLHNAPQWTRCCLFFTCTFKDTVSRIYFDRRRIVGTVFWTQFVDK